MRVYAIARELGVTSAEVLAVVSDEGEEASSLTASSGLSDEQAAQVRDAFATAGLTAMKTSPSAGGAEDAGGDSTPAQGSPVDDGIEDGTGDDDEDDGERYADRVLSERWYEFVGGSLRVGRVTYRSGDLVPMEALPTLPLHVRRKLVLHRG